MCTVRDLDVCVLCSDGTDVNMNMCAKKQERPQNEVVLFFLSSKVNVDICAASSRVNAESSVTLCTVSLSIPINRAVQSVKVYLTQCLPLGALKITTVALSCVHLLRQ